MRDLLGRLLVPAVIIGLLVVGALGFRKLQQRKRMALAPFTAGERLRGDLPAPVLEAERADGSRVRVPGTPGRVVLVHFWATWCTPCRAELPGLLALADELRRGGRFELYAVSVDASWADIREHFDGRVPDSVVRVDHREAGRRYGVASVPDTYLVDGEGRLAERFRGAFDWDTDAARAYLRAR